jgi:hypothetical protein
VIVKHQGRTLGTTPIRVDLPAGKQTIELTSAALHIKTKLTLDVSANNPNAIRRRLEQGELELRVSPWAYVSVDGKPLGSTPVPVQTLYEGEHALLFERPDLGVRDRTETTRDRSPRLRRRGVIAALAIMLSAAAAADPAALTEATQLIERADYDRVPVTLSPLLADRQQPPELRARGYVLLAIALHNLLDDAGAKNAFTRALELDRSVALPASASPRTTELFRETQRNLPPPDPPRPPPEQKPLVEPREQTEQRTRTETPRDHAWQPPLWLPITTLAASIALGVTGTALMVSGKNGRANAIELDDAALAQSAFDDAQSKFRAGSGLAIGSGVGLAVTAILFTWPFGDEEP